MTGGEGDQRLWFIVDELDALGPIDGSKDALARLRRFGGRCVLGFQSIAQVSSTYGHGEAQTIVENCSSTLILRCSASENGGTARFASKLIGEREVIRSTVSRTRRSGFLVEPTTASAAASST
jgi:type IV secretory pathway TraG/TraD family ATPase VirD4